MTEYDEDEDADDVDVLGPNCHPVVRRPGQDEQGAERDDTRDAHVRMERLMLARPTAASPAN